MFEWTHLFRVLEKIDNLPAHTGRTDPIKPIQTIQYRPYGFTCKSVTLAVMYHMLKIHLRRFTSRHRNCYVVDHQTLVSEFVVRKKTLSLNELQVMTTMRKDLNLRGKQ